MSCSSRPRPDARAPRPKLGSMWQACRLQGKLLGVFVREFKASASSGCGTGPWSRTRAAAWRSSCRAAPGSPGLQGSRLSATRCREYSSGTRTGSQPASACALERFFQSVRSSWRRWPRARRPNVHVEETALGARGGERRGDHHEHVATRVWRYEPSFSHRFAGRCLLPRTWSRAWRIDLDAAPSANR